MTDLKIFEATHPKTLQRVKLQYKSLKQAIKFNPILTGWSEL